MSAQGGVGGVGGSCGGEVEGNEKPRAGNKLNLDRQHFGRQENAFL